MKSTAMFKSQNLTEAAIESVKTISSKRINSDVNSVLTKKTSVSKKPLIVPLNEKLNGSQVGFNKIIFEQNQFKIKSSISAVLHLFKSKIQEKNLKLVTDYDHQISIILLGDEFCLRQIIFAFVHNAIIHTAKEKSTVCANLVQEDRTKVIIKFALTDTDLAIKENSTEKIFNNFQQVSGATPTQFRELELGFGNIKRLIEAQARFIYVQSSLGEGTSLPFTLSFQKTNSEIETEQKGIDVNTAIKRKSEEASTPHPLLIKTVFNKYGFEQNSIKNGIPAIEKLKEKYTDLTYLKKKKKSNLALMLEMITLYLTQIPNLIATIKESLSNHNFVLLAAATHKIIPSFSIVGISTDYENMAKKFRI